MSDTNQFYSSLQTQRYNISVFWLDKLKIKENKTSCFYNLVISKNSKALIHCDRLMSTYGVIKTNIFVSA